MSALMKTGLVVLQELGLTPRGKDMYPELGPMVTSQQYEIRQTSGILTTKLWCISGFSASRSDTYRILNF